MSLTAVLFVGVGLAMDACAVSFAKGSPCKKNVKKICPFYWLWLSVSFRDLCPYWAGGWAPILRP